MDVLVKRSEIDGTVKPPASKSYTHRVFIAASLSPKAKVMNALISEDTIATINCCKKLGAIFERKKEGWEIFGVEKISKGGYFNFMNSGTTLRIFLALLSLSDKLSTADGDSSLRSRPNRTLAITLRNLGASIYGDELYRAPLKVSGIIKGGRVKMISESSQFVSALLFALPLAKGDSELTFSTKSKPYIEVTLDILEKSGVRIECDESYAIYGEQSYKLREFSVPSDFSSTSYLIAAALLAGKVKILNVYDSRQGDKKIIDACREMGGKVRWDKEKGVLVAEKSELEGISFDASDTPDLVPTVAVLAAAAKGSTEIYNAEHLRIKEIDRIAGIRKNLEALGVRVEERRDGLKITGGKKEFFGVVDSFGDHRMVLAFSLLGLLGEVRCKNAEVVAVSYPNYFEELQKIGAKICLGKNF